VKARGSSERQADRSADNLSQSRADSSRASARKLEARVACRLRSAGGTRGTAWQSLGSNSTSVALGKGFPTGTSVCVGLAGRDLFGGLDGAVQRARPIASAEGVASGRERILDTVEMFSAGVQRTSVREGERRRTRQSGSSQTSCFGSRGAAGGGGLSARQSGRFGCFGTRAVGGRQNSKRATAAVTRYGY